MPDPELVRRRAAGETVRACGRLWVAHTTLGRYFARVEAARQLREAKQSVRAEAAGGGDAAGRGAASGAGDTPAGEEQAALARARRAAAAASAPRPRRSAYEAWLDEHDTRLPLLRADLRSRNDDLAARAVEAGGGLEAVIEATGLRTRENALRAIDPAILVRAFDNAAASPAAPPDQARLRRLVPDPELVRRRAAGETLRRLASDYGVAQTTPGPLARAAGDRQTATRALASPAHAGVGQRRPTSGRRSSRSPAPLRENAKTCSHVAVPTNRDSYRLRGEQAERLRAFGQRLVRSPLAHGGCPRSSGSTLERSEELAEAPREERE
jgi:hypothetical protein